MTSKEARRREEENAKLASIVESSIDAIIGKTLQGVITSWNRGAETIYGYRADEVLGRSAEMLFPEARRTELNHVMDEIRADRPVMPYETEHCRKNGSLIPVSVAVSPIRDAHGEPTGAAIIARDITEHKRAEEELFSTQQRLRAIMEAVPIGIAFSRDTACRAIDGNPALMSLFEARSEDNLSASASDPSTTGRRTRYFQDGRRLSEAELPLQRAVAEQRAIPATALEVRLPTGQGWLAEVSGAPIRDQQGKVIGGVAVVMDITERKRAEEALLDADRRKNEFLAMLAHELRNPLTPIRNAVQVLSRQDDLPEKAIWAAELIGRQSQQLERLVNDLLDLSRITHGQIRLQRCPVTMQDAIQGALEGVAPLMEKYRHSLETQLAETPIMLMADPVRLTQVFTNLLRNAVKYTPDGGHIQVTLARERGEATVRFRDDGVGFRPEDLPRLFDIFSRGGTGHTNVQDADGLGVGLALARQLIELHGGALEGHSDGPGKGSEFVVTLRVSPETEAADTADDPAHRVEPKRQALRVLVVDDNPDVADSFKVLLETMGCRVRTVHKGGDVPAAMREWQPQVVFVDIAMPDMDGYQVAASIRAVQSANCRPLLVALTGYSQDGDQTAAAEAGFDLHMLKPPSPEEIENLLADLSSGRPLPARRAPDPTHPEPPRRRARQR